jgi:RND superfamily putative drug exporter
MVSVFAGFVLVEDPIIKSMGFALAFGVLVDAFVVRLSLVPAVMSFLGDAAWWLPRWLDRVLPKVDIEGETLPALEARTVEPATVGAGDRPLGQDAWATTPRPAPPPARGTWSR